MQQGCFTIDESDGLRTAITPAQRLNWFDVSPYTGVKIIDGDGTSDTGPMGVTPYTFDS